MTALTPQSPSQSDSPSLAPSDVQPDVTPANSMSVPDETPPPTNGRRWWRIIIPAGVVVAGVVTALAVTSGGDAEDSVEPVALQAVSAEQRDLIEYNDLDGTMIYASTRTVSAGATGTITEITEDGDVLTRGDIAFAVNADPVAVFYGDVPLYRPLSEGTEGDDVLLLEQNLASLGYNATEDDDGDEVNTDFTVDGIYDTSTAAAVVRWQDDLGLAETGTVDPNDVIVVSGPSVASSITVDVGSVVHENSPILDVNMTGVERGFYAAHTGEVELQATSGPIEAGQIVYTVDELPVAAVVVDPDREVVFERDLFAGVSDGEDVRVLEETLLALGYDADGDLDIDEEFDEDTEEALIEWQEDLQGDWDDVSVDGVFDLDDYVVVTPGTSVDAVTERESETVALGSELFVTLAVDDSRVVTTSVPVEDQDSLVEGQEVDVAFPDGSIVTGTVTKVAISSVTDPTDPNAVPELPVEIALVSVPDSVGDFSQLDVEIKLVDEIATGVTVVPVSALVATDSGYAVEVSTGSGTQFVAVEPGMFADGFVEVSGIEPGTAVVVPR